MISGLLFGHFAEEWSFSSAFLVVLGCGSILVILPNKNNLSFSPILFSLLKIGKMSYSIYLIHLPVIVIYRYQKFLPLNLLDFLLITVIVLVFSLLQYTVIENPFRAATKNLRSSTVIIVFIATSLFSYVFFLNIYPPIQILRTIFLEPSLTVVLLNARRKPSGSPPKLRNS